MLQAYASRRRLEKPKHAMIASAVFGAVFLLSGFAHNADAAKSLQPVKAAKVAPAVIVTISAQSPFRVGDRMALDIVFSNRSSSLMELRGPRAGPTMDFHVINQQTLKELPQEFTIEEAVMNPGQLSFVELKPGEEWKTTFDVAHFVRLTEPGVYTIQLGLPTTVHNPAMPANRPIVESSNVITVAVTQ